MTTSAGVAASGEVMSRLRPTHLFSINGRRLDLRARRGAQVIAIRCATFADRYWSFQGEIPFGEIYFDIA